MESYERVFGSLNVIDIQRVMTTVKLISQPPHFAFQFNARPSMARTDSWAYQGVAEGFIPGNSSTIALGKLTTKSSGVPLQKMLP